MILKLKPALKDYIWGGQKLKTDFGFQSDMDIVAEGWMLTCHKDRENIVKSLCVFAERLFSEFVNRFGKRLTGKFSVFDNIFAVFVTGKHPTFGDNVHVALKAEIGFQLLSAPNVIF